ncbi:alpha-galactosidase A precursor [Pochonia chlamydosporia 170]|uniref:Alpha-galactosidase A n=1 Tax=Pochonia chlamydosporia 170 TaxID=1380566 RepID=A0A179G7P0_METCM|nr:alpha-galactosidase A precursor [Pochonia chlamydosporia 170]OAQ73805.1 alpha-galactosidase A precursor [Pochonia chlamydosporia 170]
MAPDIQLLQASIDEDDESEFRMLVDKKAVKYITIAPGLFSNDDMCFAPSLISHLPPFPPGGWNEVFIARDPKSGHAYFESVRTSHLPGITPTWHVTQIDHLELTMGDKLRSNVYEATCPRFPSTVVAKFARFAWEIPQLAEETRAYSLIEGQGIGPEFLGYLTEEGRVIGFLMEHIKGAHHAEPDDFQACHRVLSKLHKLGLKHGDINKHNFLVREGQATLIDFDVVTKEAGREELDAELASLRDSLADESGRGGRIVEEK